MTQGPDPHYHSLLLKQIKRASRFSADGSCDWNALLDLVSRAYEEQETLRERQTRASDLMAGEILESKHFLDLVISRYPGGLFWKNKDGMFIGCNDFVIKLFNLEARDQLIGKPIDQLGLPQEFVSRYQNEENWVVENKLPVLESVYTLKDTFDAEAYLAISTIPLFDAHDDIVGILGVINDITQKVMADKELGRYRYQLETLVEEQTRDIRAAKDQAERASNVKSEFLANMSHELRTPLNSILGMIGIVLRDDGLSAEQRDMLRIVNQSANNLLETVNDVLDLSKIESNAVVLEHIGFDFTATLNSVIEALAPIASAKGIALNNSYKNTGMPYLSGDPARVRRILTNLVGNAIKYTDAGSVTIKTDFRTDGENGIVLECSVSDTGIGIPEDKLKSIFQKFTQADETITRKYGGTGLGLAITKDLVELMDGQIGVDSQLGKGSTFWIKIPFPITDRIVADVGEKKRDRIAARKREITDGSSIRARDARILVAEDHPLNQAFIEKLLISMGLSHLKIVDNGVAACHYSDLENPDLILMDCHMPQMTGYDATKKIRIREQDSGRHVPIIALTADAMEGTRQKCLDAGMDEYISKPIDKDELLEILSCWINFDDRAAPKTTIANTSGESMQDDTPIIDLSSLDLFADTPEEKQEFIGIFTEQGRQDIEILQENCTDGVNMLWRDTAHRLKGSAGTIGAGRMHAVCKEAQVEEASAAQRRDLVARIETAFTEACKELEKAT